MAEGKVAVCTGSGRPGGLGEAILSRLGKEGYRLVVTDVDGLGSSHLAKPDEMEAVAESLSSQGAEVLSHACDVRSPESVEEDGADDGGEEAVTQQLNNSCCCFNIFSLIMR